MKSTLLTLAAMAFALVACAQWVPTNGPYGGRTNHFAFNDEVWFAGTPYGGVFVSDNNGASWQKRNNGFADLGPSGLQVTALYADNDVAYIGIGVNGFYRSYDHGLNWESMTSFWSSYVLNKIARSGDNLFVGSAGGGIHRSTDNGTTWASAMNGILAALSYTVTSLVVQDTYVYAAVNGKLYRTDDNGEEWNLLFSGLPENTYEVNLCGDVLIAVTSQGMYRSTNNGDLWSMSNTGIDTQTILFLKSTTFGNEIYICDQYYSSFYSSNDFGLTWTPLDYPFENAMYAIHALGNNRLLFQTDISSNGFPTQEPCGLYLSENAGLTWTNITHEIDATFCMSLASLGNDLYCSTSGNGVYKTSDGGTSWAQTGLTDWQVRVLRNLDGKIFAGGSNGIHISDDGGQSWVLSVQGLTNISVNDFARIDDSYFTATADGVFISTDNGLSWSPQSNGIASPYVLSLYADGPTLYAGANGGIYTSTNYGNSWSSLGTGLPASASITSIVLHNGNLLVTTGAGIYRLSNGSTEWELVSEGSFVADAHRLKVIDNKIFACRLAPVVNYDGVFVSFDGGSTWEGQSQGITNNQVWDIEANGDFVYVATLGSGCFKRHFSEFVTSGIVNTSDADLRVYPNPVSDQLIVQVDSKYIGEPFAVYNAIGEIMEQHVSMYNVSMTIDVSAYPSGYYFVRTGASTQRFVVQH